MSEVVLPKGHMFSGIVSALFLIRERKKILSIEINFIPSEKKAVQDTHFINNFTFIDQIISLRFILSIPALQ